MSSQLFADMTFVSIQKWNDNKMKLLFYAVTEMTFRTKEKFSIYFTANIENAQWWYNLPKTNQSPNRIHRLPNPKTNCLHSVNHVIRYFHAVIHQPPQRRPVVVPLSDVVIQQHRQYRHPYFRNNNNYRMAVEVRRVHG